MSAKHTVELTTAEMDALIDLMRLVKENEQHLPGWRTPALMRVRRRVHAARYLAGPKQEQPKHVYECRPCNVKFEGLQGLVDHYAEGCGARRTQSFVDMVDRTPPEKHEQLVGQYFPGSVKAPMKPLGNDCYQSENRIPAGARFIGIDTGEKDATVAAVILQPFPPKDVPVEQTIQVGQSVDGRHMWAVPVSEDHVVLVLAGKKQCDCVNCQRSATP